MNLIQGLRKRLNRSLVKRAEHVNREGRAHISRPWKVKFNPTQIQPLMQELLSDRNDLVRFLNRFSPEDVRQSGLEWEANAMIGHLDRNYQSLADLDWFFTGNYMPLIDEANHLASQQNLLPSYFLSPNQFDQILPRLRQLIPVMNDLSARFGPRFGQMSAQLQQFADQIQVYQAFVQSGTTIEQVRNEWQTMRNALRQTEEQINQMHTTINAYMNGHPHDIEMLGTYLNQIGLEPSPTPYSIRAVEFVRNRLQALIDRLQSERINLVTGLIQPVPGPIMQRAGIIDQVNYYQHRMAQLYNLAVHQRQRLEGRIAQMQEQFDQLQQGPAGNAQEHEEHLEELQSSSSSFSEHSF